MEDFRLIPPDHNYYVYALIDPRDNEIFYIGKGKGDRYKAHYKTNNKDENKAKKAKTRQIKTSGYEVEVVKLLAYLNEETAFQIEKIIIYNIGRKIFNEGCLTNIVKGGKQHPDASSFYEKELNVSLLKEYQSAFNSKFKKYLVKQSEIIFLSELKFKIFEYELNGSLINIFDTVDFFKDSIYSSLFIHFLDNESPIFFCNKVFSKNEIQNFYISKYKVYVDYCPYNNIFFNLLDLKLAEKKPFKLDYRIDQNFCLFATLNNNELTLGSKINNVLKIYEILHVYDLNSIIAKKDYQIESSNLKKPTLSSEELIERDKSSADWEKFNGRLK